MAGISKEQRTAKKTLENVTDLHEKINEDVIEAYNIISGLAKDPTQPATVRKACAQEIIKLHWMFVEVSDKLVPETGDREGDRKTEPARQASKLFSTVAK